MEYPLLAPVEGCVIKCLAVDQLNTYVRDDGFRITRKGKFTQIDMVAVIPPEEKLREEDLLRSLHLQVNDKTRCGKLELFRPHVRYPYSLSEGVRDVIIVTHLIHRNDLVREEVSIGRAIAEQTMTHAEYAESARLFEDEIAIMRSLKTKRRTWRHVENCRSKDFLQHFGKCGVALYAMLELFNHSCRAEADRWKSPFVTFLTPQQSQPGFRIGGYARFNCGLRDPCAFINTTNLVRRLKGLDPFLAEHELVKILPRIL